MSGRSSAAAAGVALLASAACTLQEIVLAEPEDVVVAEAHVHVADGDRFPANRVSVFLHRTIGGGGEVVPDARVTVTRPNGMELVVPELPADSVVRCVYSSPAVIELGESSSGTCYLLDGTGGVSEIAPGERLELRIELSDGGVLTSAATLPGDFELAGIDAGASCVLAASTPLELRWSTSEGAWAYVTETYVWDLDTALEPLGIEVESPLYLFGLSIAETDTTIVFPGELGVFNRFELDRGLAAILQQGLPAWTHANVSVSAVDRNYVNWERGGNFNPSGRVRLPSIRGDGTGVFGATVVRDIHVHVDPADSAEGTWGHPPCPS